MRPPDEVHSLTERELPDDVVDGWRTLLTDLGIHDYCATPDWALAWWATIGGRPPAEVAVWRDDTDVVAVAAVHLHRERLARRIPVPLRAWSNLGSGIGNGDHLAVPAAPHVRADVAAWLHTRSGRRPLWLRSLAPSEPSTDDVTAAVGPNAVVTGGIVCPSLDLGGDTLPIPPSFARKLRAYRRRLEREGVAFTVAGPGDVTDRHLRALYDLHEDRWDTVDAGPSWLRRRHEFFGRLVASASDTRGPVVTTAERDGEPVGALLAFACGPTVSYFQSGWSPAYRSHSLGSVLVDETIAWAHTRGATSFDMMRGTGEFKYRFGATDRVDRSVLYPNGPTGRLLAWKHRARR